MKINNETKIGILVIVVAIILGVITWEAGDFDFTPEGYQLKVYFKNIDGVELNAPVTVNGFEVGRVDDIKIIYGRGPDTNVELTLWIDASARIRKGAQAYVKNMGFLGEKYVGITSGDKMEEFYKDGEAIEGTDPGSMEKIMSDAEVVAENLKEISANVKERLEINKENIDDIVARMRVSMKNIESISSNINERLEKNKHLIDDFVVQMNSASRNFEDMSYDLKLNPWKLMYKEPRKNKRIRKEVKKSD